jgi:ASCH domain
LRKVDGCDPGGTFAPGATAVESRPDRLVALSVRQPWAALLVGGRKTIDVRTWPTKLRGAILIHAGKVPDKRPDGWVWVDSPDLSVYANSTGGVIGIADLVECVTYRSAEAFAADRGRHRNSVEWFRPPVLYGFRFENPRPVRFEPYKGNTFFFPVKGMSLS